MLRLWHEELLSQTFPHTENVDITKLLIIYYILEYNSFNVLIKKEDINKYIYRFYIDNPELALKHPNSIVKNIYKYGVEHIEFLLDNALYSWENDFNDGALQKVDNNVILKIDSNDYNLIHSSTKKIANFLFKKYTSLTFNYQSTLAELSEMKENDLFKINESRMKNRVLETHQFCVLCDSISYNDFKIVPLNKNIKDYSNSYNYVIVCNTHYHLYDQKYYDFDDRGKIIIYKKDENLNIAMRVPHKLMKKYYKN